MNHSDFSNQSFLPASPASPASLMTCIPLKPEIGKENIRFPAFICDGKPSKRDSPAKLVFGLRREESALAECPVTGIVLSVGIPALPFALSYENPIAKEKNARKIAALSASDLASLEADILAGTFLSLLSANALIEDRKTGLERNNLLCQHYQQEDLITFLTITSKVLNHFSKPERLKRFVEESQTISLNDFADNVMPIVQGWLLSITPASTVSKAEEEKSASLKLKQAVQVRQNRENISLSLRSKIKVLALELGKQEVISQKASSIFQFLGTGQNWKTLTKDSKISYIAYLSEKLISSAEGEDNIENVETLITLLREIPVLDTYRVLVEEEETPSSIVAPSVKKPLSLQERLSAIALAKKEKVIKMITSKPSWTPAQNVLNCFLREHNLLESEIREGSILNRNHPYRIIFDSQEEGLDILAQLPLKVLVSFQVFEGGETVAIIRKLTCKNSRKGKEI